MINNEQPQLDPSLTARQNLQNAEDIDAMPPAQTTKDVPRTSTQEQSRQTELLPMNMDDNTSIGNPSTPPVETVPVASVSLVVLNQQTPVANSGDTSASELPTSSETRSPQANTETRTPFDIADEVMTLADVTPAHVEAAQAEVSSEGVEPKSTDNNQADNALNEQVAEQDLEDNPEDNSKDMNETNATQPNTDTMPRWLEDQTRAVRGLRGKDPDRFRELVDAGVIDIDLVRLLDDSDAATANDLIHVESGNAPWAQDAHHHQANDGCYIHARTTKTLAHWSIWNADTNGASNVSMPPIALLRAAGPHFLPSAARRPWIITPSVPS
jgi:hypothetical protein